MNRCFESRRPGPVSSPGTSSLRVVWLEHPGRTAGTFFDRGCYTVRRSRSLEVPHSVSALPKPTGVFKREDRLMQKPKLIVGSIVVVVGAIAWYLFRPELIFVHKTVN